MLIKHFRYLLYILLMAPLTILATEQPSINMLYYRETSKDLLVEAMEKFEQETNIKVNLIFMSINELKSFLIKGKMGNTLPDIALTPSDFVPISQDIDLSVVPKTLING